MAAIRQSTGAQPLYVLAGGSRRFSGAAATDSNVRAGRAVADAVRTTLGPRGMDKLLVDSTGNVVITNDGATILQEMDIEHPAAQMIVDVARTQEDEVGDGTTTAAVLAGQLLARAAALLEDDVHPTAVVEGYHEAARVAHEAIEAAELDVEVDTDLLETVAAASMTGKGTGGLTAETLAARVVGAVEAVHGEGFDRDDVRVHTQVGASTAATDVVRGVLLSKEPVNDGMPRHVEDATVLVLDAPLTVRKSEAGAEYRVTNVDQLTAAVEAEEGELRGLATTIREGGVDVVFCTKDVDKRVGSFLAAEGVLAFERVTGSDARAITRATGATRVGSVADLDAADFGHVESVRTERYGGDDLTVVEGGADAGVVTVFVRGGTEHVVDELERAIGDAVDVVVATLETGAVVPGAGATEIAIADAVRSRAAGVSGRKQLAVEAFADAVEVVPRTLAENAGMDPIDAIVDLRAMHETAGRAGLVVAGERAEIADPVAAGVLDPASVKHGAVESATEAATMIVRIDDVIAAK